MSAFLISVFLCSVTCSHSHVNADFSRHISALIDDKISKLQENFMHEQMKKDKTIQILQNELKHMRDNFTNMNHTITKELENLKKTCYVNDLNRDTRLLLPSGSTDQPNIVAFTAVLTHLLALGELQEIKYDKVILNIGNGYDSRHGHFTAPIKGIYLMSASTMKNHIAENLYVEMVKNGVQLVANVAGTEEYVLGTHTIAVLLEKGDMVWMRHYKSTVSVTVHGAPKEPMTSFSGVLLFPL